MGFSHKRLPEIVPSTAQAEQVRLTVPPTMDNALPIFEQVQIATEKYIQSITYKVLPKTRFSFGTAYLVVVVQCYSEVLPCPPSFDYTRSKRHLKVPESAFIPPLETVGFHPPILFCKNRQNPLLPCHEFSVHIELDDSVFSGTGTTTITIDAR